MTINQLIENATKSGEYSAVDVFNKIISFSEQNNISIYRAARYLITLKPSIYERNLLYLVLRYYSNDTDKLVRKSNEIGVNISKQNNLVDVPEHSIEDFIKNKPIIKYKD